jgi:DNA polymerase III alpha subunit (gram-positive type)
LFVAWNAPFDWGFVEAEFARCGLTPPLVPRLDPLVWSRQLMPNEKSHRLQRVADKLGVPLQHAHRAENDAEAAGRIALRFADKLPVPLEALLRDQEAWRKAQDEARAARAAARGGQPEDDDDEAVDSRQAGLFG